MARPLVKVDVDSLDVDRMLRQFPQVLDVVADRVVEDETEAVAADMRRFAPRATGALVQSVQAEHRRGKAFGTAAATARHAQFVERGTKRAKAQPYAEPARELSGPRLRNRLIEAINQEIRRWA